MTPNSVEVQMATPLTIPPGSRTPWRRRRMLGEADVNQGSDDMPGRSTALFVLNGGSA